MENKIYQAHNINFRLVEVEDAEFILSLRKDKKYNKYLSKVNGGILEQREWIEKYKLVEAESKQFYFIIYNDNDERIGTIRIYDISFKKKTFCWGSWILTDKASWSSSLQCIALIYHIGFEVLGLELCKFEVQKLNLGVVKLHQKLGAKIFGENDEEYFLQVDKVIAKLIIKKNLK
jgi:RimJ/RimL family protein N-acetyltransferase